MSWRRQRSLSSRGTTYPWKAAKDFRWIGKPVARLDMRDKSTGRAVYSIDIRIDGMLHAAVQHAPIWHRAEMIANEAEVRAMPGVQAVAATAGRGGGGGRHVVAGPQGRRGPPGDLDQAGIQRHRDRLPELLLRSDAGRPQGHDGAQHPSRAGGRSGCRPSQALPRLSRRSTTRPISLAPQLEPPSAVGAFAGDGSLDLWLPNQMPEVFQQVAAKTAGLQPDQVRIHSPLLGGFFGRHFTTARPTPFPQAFCSPRQRGVRACAVVA